VLEEERKEVRDQILDRLQPGDVVEGKISNIVDFGAFVDLEGIDGLIHISELSWSHVNHPTEVVAIGDTVKIKVLDIDRDRQRISLGLKQTQEDPWQRVVSTYRSGDVLEGKVTKVVSFGAFVEILDGVEGLVHISELADHHVENPSEVVELGATLNVKILEIDEERRRLSLSIKRVEGQNMLLKDLGAAIQAASGPEDEGSTEGVSAEVEATPDLEVSEEVSTGEAPAVEEESGEEPTGPTEAEEAAEVEETAEADAGSEADEIPEAGKSPIAEAFADAEAAAESQAEAAEGEAGADDDAPEGDGQS